MRLAYHQHHYHLVGDVVTVHEQVVLQFLAQAEKTHVLGRYIGEPLRINVLLFNALDGLSVRNGHRVVASRRPDLDLRSAKKQ